ncbi:MAG: cell division protein ZapA, partial [Bacteroidia bacterium]|nr:cell division protein ZapA [Bacteroidia bacterium]
KINDTVNQYKLIYRDKDSQDFLAMAALQFVTKLQESEERQNLAPVLEEISLIEAELSEYLTKE